MVRDLYRANTPLSHFLLLPIDVFFRRPLTKTRTLKVAVLTAPSSGNQGVDGPGGAGDEGVGVGGAALLCRP